MKRRIGVRQRFWAKASTSGGPASCWVWKAGRSKGGYGKHMLWMDGKKKHMNAHRAAWLLAKGDIPKGMLVRHSCDNSLCVNPAHLSLGSQLQNMKERVERGHAGHYRRPELPWRPSRRGRLFRFWSKVSLSGGPDSCWTWKGARSPDGYGCRKGKGLSRGAHRAAWELARGPIPEGMEILHRCDNPSCVNLQHLRIGTQAENIADMCAKGRQRTGSRPGRLVKWVTGDDHWTRKHPERCLGEKNPAARFTPEQVIEIRRRFSGMKRFRGLKAAAEEFGVTTQTIRHILLEKSWAHLSSKE